MNAPVPKHQFGPPEPPWMNDLREIEASIDRSVKRYIRWVKFQLVLLPVITGLLCGGSAWLVMWLATRAG